MFSNYIKIAWRNLLRERLFSGINLLSLSAGIATTLLIALWVQNELRYDQYHRRADQIYRITTDLKVSPTDHWYWATTPLRITELAAQAPGVLQSAQLKSDPYIEVVLRRGAAQFLEKKVAWVSENWFNTFDYAMLEGSAAPFADNPKSVILTRRKARQIFGGHASVGESIRVDSLDYEVCAVVADPPPNSSFDYDTYFPAKVLLTAPEARKNEESWGNFNYQTYVELHEDAQPDAAAAQISRLLQAAKQDSNIVLGLQPLADVHFDTQYEDGFKKGHRSSIQIFALIGLLILGMACINYVSLTTARAAIRAREMSIKKITGANNSHIFAQMMAESGVLAVISLFFAVLLVKLALPVFNALTEQSFTFALDSPLGLSLIGGVLAVTLVLSGIYPAWLMSRFRPMHLLQGRGLQISTKSPLRQGLVVVQFAISAALISSTLVIWQQRRFIQNKPLGFDRHHTFTFTTRWDGWQHQGREKGLALRNALEADLRKESAIAQLSIASQPPVNLLSTHSGSIQYEGKPADAAPTVSQVCADEHFARLFDLKLAEGRWFEPHNQADENNVLLNETACREFNLKKPWAGQSFEFHGRKGQVIGVVRDFHFKSLHHPITPLVMFNQPEWRLHFFVKHLPGQEQQALAAAERVWKSHFPQQPFQYKYLDDNYDRLYGSEHRAGALFNVFAGLAILISCMGLFGLAVFVASRRTKEIGIRKVLGASVAGLAGLLARDFLKLVLIAIAIAAPLAYYAMEQWLSDFAYRIEIQWWMFTAAAAAALAIAFLTVGGQAVKAALANPVKSLRSE